MVGFEKGGLELYDIRCTDLPVWQLRPPTNLDSGPVKVIEFQSHNVKKNWDSKSSSSHWNCDQIKTPSATLDNFRMNSQSGKRLARPISPRASNTETVPKLKALKYNTPRPDEVKQPTESVDLPPSSILAEPSLLDVFSPIKKKPLNSFRNPNGKPLYKPLVFSKRSDNISPEKTTLNSGLNSPRNCLNKTGFSPSPLLKALKETEVIDLDEVATTNPPSPSNQLKPPFQPPPSLPSSPKKLARENLNLPIENIPNTDTLENLETKNNILVNLVREVVRDTNRSLRVDIKNDINSVHLELLSQIQDLKLELRELLNASSQVPELQQRIRVLEEENRRLRLDY